MIFGDALLRSSVPGIDWPAIPDQRAARLLAVLAQLEAAQWLPREKIEALQFRQLQRLLAHCHATVPYYREHLARAGFSPSTPLTREIWGRLPILERADIQEAGAALHSSRPPPEHGKVDSIDSSGSTGRPIHARKSALTDLFFSALSLREHVWHRRDFSGVFAVIRRFSDGTGLPPEGLRGKDWGPPVSWLYDSGPGFGLSIKATSAEAADWLRRVDPHYLLLFPSMLRDLVEHSKATGWRPGRLKQVRTLSEQLDPELRERCRREWGVPVIDMYSAREAGYLALQCPEHEHFHTVETVYAEVIGEDGRACQPGEVGRMIVTPLHNFAMPLLRYAVGDYVEAGAQCTCGRGLPVLGRILGRVRNMLTLPSGGRIWPLFRESKYHEVLPVRQAQFIQKSLQRLEMRLVSERRGTPEEEARLRNIITGRLGAPYEIDFVYMDEIPRDASGKFEDFKSELA